MVTSLFAFAAMLAIGMNLNCHAEDVKPREDTSMEEFAFRLYRGVSSDAQGKSTLVSPLSASVALAVLGAGADGDTFSEISSVIGLPEASHEELGSYFRSMIGTLRAADPSCAMEIADAVWHRPEVILRDSFAEDASHFYDAEVRVADFPSDDAVREVNRWCAERTHGKIGSIMDRDSATGIALAILNAVYFYGPWEKPFDGSYKDTFRCADGSRSDVMMLRNTARYMYAEDDCFKAVEIPYGDGRFVMDVILPQEGQPLSPHDLDAARWRALADNLEYVQVRLSLPKFTLEGDMCLNDILSQMGMPSAFNAGADFSRMSSDPLCVSQVIQKTFMKVDENGTEAAAVTAVAMKATALPPVAEPVVFKADRPFLFLIRDSMNGTVLFIGDKLM